MFQLCHIWPCRIEDLNIGKRLRGKGTSSASLNISPIQLAPDLGYSFTMYKGKYLVDVWAKIYLRAPLSLNHQYELFCFIKFCHLTLLILLLIMIDVMWQGRITKSIGLITTISSYHIALNAIAIR